MINFNKYILIFLVFVAALITSVLQFIQSENFARFAVKEIETRFLQDTGVKLFFERAGVSLLPPATFFRGVEVSYRDSEQEINVVSKEVRVEFSFINMLASDLVFETVTVVDAKVELVKADEVDTKKASKKESDEQQTGLLSQIIDASSGVIEQIHSALPVQINELDLRRVYFSTDGGSGFVSHLDLKIYSNFLIGEFELNELYHPGEFEDITLNVIDSISGKFEMSKTSIQVKDFELKNKLNVLNGDGDLRFEDESYTLQLEYKGGLDGQFKRLLSKYNEWAEGYAEAKVELHGKSEEFKARLDLSLTDFKSEYVEADKANLSLSVDNNILRLDSLELNHDQGNLRLISGLDLLDLKKNELGNLRLSLAVSDFHTNSALFAIRDDLDVLKARLSGKIDVSYSESMRRVSFLLNEGFRMRDFSLELGGEHPLFLQKEISLPRGLVTLQVDNSLVGLDLEFNFGESKIISKGEIGLGRIDINITDSFLNFDELGPISNFPIQGRGPIELKIHGALKDVVFDIDLDHNSFSLLGYNLENVRGKASLTLEPLVLNVNELVGKYEGAKYDTRGFVNFDKDTFSLDINVVQMNYPEMRHIIAPIATLIPSLPDNLSYSARGKFHVGGTFEDDGVEVTGRLMANHIFYQDEDIEEVSFDLSFKKSNLSLRNISLKKSQSVAKGHFSINFMTDFFEYDVSWTDIHLSDWNFYNVLNLGLNSKVELDLYGSGLFKDFTTRTQLTLTDSSVQGSRLEDSLVTVFNESNEFYINAALFGRMFELDSYVNTDGTKANDPSRLTARINVPDIRIPLGLLSSHNISNSQLEGRLFSEIKSDFYTNTYEELNFTANVSELNFKLYDVLFQPLQPLKLNIEKGRFVGNELALASNKSFYLKPTLRGSLARGLNLAVDFDLPASLIGLLSPDFVVSAGSIKGKSTLRGKLMELDHDLELSSNDVNLQIPQVPGVIEKINVGVRLNNRNLIVPKGTAIYGKGRVEVEGMGAMEFPYPSLNLNLSVDNSYISLMKRSGGVVSGKANLTGTRPPYLLQGHVDILFAEIIENINDFQTTTNQVGTYQRFLPRQDGATLSQPIILDLTFSILRPLLVRNSLLELNVEGDASIKGSPRNPLVEGRFASIPASSKFKFKGHEFNLTKGTVDIGRTFQREGALLDFSGVAQINEYRVRLDVSGRTKNVSVALSSEPNLSQEDIFSLLTLGVTSEISTELEESERQSVATVGLGALLADQLRLNEGLDSSFGLRLSVAPEYAEETTSLLQGKSAVSDSSSSKFRSATRIRLQKKISDRVDLSVSSTVGGSLDQRQEMNINYRINNRWSLEGVYELKSTEDEGVESSDSIGADLKYRWAF